MHEAAREIPPFFVELQDSIGDKERGHHQRLPPSPPLAFLSRGQENQFDVKPDTWHPLVRYRTLLSLNKVTIKLSVETVLTALKHWNDTA